ncbi:DUF6232 family protein [Pseudoduganella aquatica]|uniref:DUF6232 family protein n=1 Tax=Pseudoduganella aquatica TaxID=2660641 RepID=UPI001E626DFA|nr:DUF6232 family protein [Pseudoduganella aquatica]
MNQERVYFDNGKVKVTNSRVVVLNQTYAMSGITSVSFVEEKPNRLLPVALAIGGAVGAGSLGLNIWVCAAAVLPGVAWLLIQRSRFSIAIGSASGDTKALTSKYKDFVHGVVDAINAAIIERG